MSEVYIAPVGSDDWQPLGHVAEFKLSWNPPEDYVDQQALYSVLTGGTISWSLKLSPAQAHEVRWTIKLLARSAKRPKVWGPRPLAYGCLPKRR